MRLFAAVDIGPEVADRIRQAFAPLQPRLPDLRFVGSDRFHVTVRFYGEVPAAGVAALEVALGAVRTPAGVLDLGGVGGFPSLASPRVVWVGIRDPSGALAALHLAVDAASVAAGFGPADRPFSPHLTIARARKGRRPRPEPVLAAIRDLDFGRSPLCELVLYESRLGPAGPAYAARLRVALG